MIIPCLSEGDDHDIVTEVKSTSSIFKFIGADDAKGKDEYMNTLYAVSYYKVCSRAERIS